MKAELDGDVPSLDGLGDLKVWGEQTDSAPDLEIDIFSRTFKFKPFSNFEHKYFSKLATLSTNSANSLNSVSFSMIVFPNCCNLKNSYLF